MTHKNLLFLAVLLILLGVVIEFLVMDRNPVGGFDLPEFFAGILAGTGIAILLITLFRRSGH